MQLEQNEIDQLLQLRNDYQLVKVYIGEAILLIDDLQSKLNKAIEEKDAWISAHKQLIQRDIELNSLLVQKYGAGKIDMDTKEFTSI